MHGSTDSHKPTHFRKRVLVSSWIAVLAIAMAGWIAALGYIAFLLVKRLL